MQVGDLSRFRFAGINNRQNFVRVLGKLPQNQGSTRHLMTHHAVPADSHQHISIFLIRNGTQILASQDSSLGPEMSGQFLSQGTIMIAGTQTPQQAYAKSGLEVAGLSPSPHIGDGTRTILIFYFPQAGRDLSDSLFPAYAHKFTVHFFQGVLQSLVMMLKVGDVHTFATHITLTAGIALVSSYFDNAVVFN